MSSFVRREGVNPNSMDGVRDLDHIDLGMELKLGWREPVNKTPVASSVKKSGKPKRTSNQMR